MSTGYNNRYQYPRVPKGEQDFLFCIQPGCQLRFETTAELTAHMKEHALERPYNCTHSDCGQVFAHLATLIIHTARKHKGKNAFRCPFWGCPGQFATPNLLTTHVKEHEREMQQYTVPVYPLVLPDITPLKSQGQTQGEGPLMCMLPPCSMVFDTVEDLERHTRLHPERGYKCVHPGCGDSFSQPQALARHRMGQHPLDDPIRLRCKIIGCQDDLYSVQTLDEHMQLWHLGVNSQDNKEAMFCCSFTNCNCIFDDMDNLADHLEQHEWRENQEKE